MTIKKPNLFDFATSELSQDAFICWLLSWAKTENKVLNEKLHNISISFLNSIFEKFPKIEKPVGYNDVFIKKQYGNKKNKIDVLCVINNKYSIIIEDKTNTSESRDQLNRYKNLIEKDFPDTKLMPIYYKTGNQSNYSRVTKAGYEVYLRVDAISALNSRSDNDIHSDYLDKLIDLENSTNSYKTNPLNMWTYKSWEGFYMCLQKKLGEGNWGYVSNPRQGFLGFWWHSVRVDDVSLYLQIDHKMKAITIKISSASNEEIAKSTRNKWKKHITYIDENFEIKNPKRVAPGRTVTIGYIVEDFRQEKSDRTLNIESTIRNLRSIEKIIDLKAKNIPR